MTMARMLAASTAREPNATAIIDGDTRLTYAEWQGDIRRLAGGLNELGLSSGDHLVAD
jgi:2-furoate---CoA ligase